MYPQKILSPCPLSLCIKLGAACPECRTKGVFVNAMELKTTEKLIRQRRAPFLRLNRAGVLMYST